MFDITSVLKNVSEPDTGEDRIEYIDLDLIDPDPNNFYSLDGLDELAANIELIGLQQPLRVRPGQDDRVTIVSGHRRRAACMMLRDGGNEKFQKVPCIMDHGENSPAMQELRLIYANAATRVMGPAEISKQAERVEMLLYQLQEEGIKFPGRMRDHVAEACKVSKTKLARLHAIRKNLAPDLLTAYFDTGLLNESVAYALSQQDPELQRWIIDHFKATHKDKVDWMQEWWVKNFSGCSKAMDELVCRKTAGGGPCIHKREHVEKQWRSGYQGYDGCLRVINGDSFAATCCADCSSLASCSVSCSRCDKLKARMKADLKAQRQSERETQKAEEANRAAQKELEESQAAIYWARLGGALKDAGMSFWDLQDQLAGPHDISGDIGRILCDYRLGRDTIENLLDGKPAKNDSAQIPTPFTFGHYVDDAQRTAKMADLLGVSLDYLMLRTDIPNPAAAAAGTPQWSEGTPTVPGTYETRIGVGGEDTAKTGQWQRMNWDGSEWKFSNGTGLPRGCKVFRWVLLPEV